MYTSSQCFGATRGDGRNRAVSRGEDRCRSMATCERMLYGRWKGKGKAQIPLGVEVAVAPRSHEVMQEAGSAGEQAGEGQEQLTLAETVP